MSTSAAMLPSTPPFTECVSNGDASTHAPADSRQMAKRLQELIEAIEQQANPSARALLQECLETLLAFHGEGLQRILRHVQGAGTDGQKISDRIMKDSSLRGLLLIHGLHPDNLETRLRQALDTVRPYMQSHGGNIELLVIENDVARVKLQGTCKSCPSSTVTLELAVRRAVEEACPDLLGIEVAQETSEPAMT